MKTEEIISELNQSGSLSVSTINEIEKNRGLRVEMVDYFTKNKNRDFVLALLNIFSDLWRGSGAATSDTLMLACFLLGKHGHIEDSIKIWETKMIDFDTYCCIDSRLIPFAGAGKTIEYLKTQESQSAKDTLKFLVAWDNLKDLDLEEFHGQIPWFV